MKNLGNWILFVVPYLILFALCIGLLAPDQIAVKTFAGLLFLWAVCATFAAQQYYSARKNVENLLDEILDENRKQIQDMQMFIENTDNNAREAVLAMYAGILHTCFNEKEEERRKIGAEPSEVEKDFLKGLEFRLSESKNLFWKLRTVANQCGHDMRGRTKYSEFLPKDAEKRRHHRDELEGI